MANLYYRPVGESANQMVSEEFPLPVQTINPQISAIAIPTNLEQVTVSSTAIGLTVTKYADSASRCDVYVETAPIRVRWDGLAPTASVGLLLSPGDCLPLLNSTEMASFKAIATTGTSATITVVYCIGTAGAQRMPVQRGLFTDASGNANINQNTLTAGEDQTVGVLKVEQRFGYTNITLAAPTATVVKSGAGFLHCITFNKPIATCVATIYDNSAASGTIIGTITIPANPMQTTYLYDVLFTTGLTVNTATAASDITVCWR